MKHRFAVPFSLVAVALAAVLAGCGKSQPPPANARERRVPPPIPSSLEVSRWKEDGFKGRVYGIIVEQDGTKISASLYALEEGEGLVIRERESQGKYFPDRKALVFPLYNPASVPVEEWITTGGPHVVVPWDPQATKLFGSLNQPGHTNHYNFVKLESVTPTYPSGSPTRTSAP